jgi:hypothetical protein
MLEAPQVDQLKPAVRRGFERIVSLAPIADPEVYGKGQESAALCVAPGLVNISDEGVALGDFERDGGAVISGLFLGDERELTTVVVARATGQKQGHQCRFHLAPASKVGIDLIDCVLDSGESHADEPSADAEGQDEGQRAYNNQNSIFFHCFAPSLFGARA